ncbi:hypothetical protein [Halomicrococcus sp. SG-WS-1]|uniref:hypothetical protein n=1 Tax=Halomicrococcus sp. SG-WS-1 TaxID=3439057 RepID=UPI003F794D14
MAESNETRLARFTGWFRRRPTSLEFWELLVTDRRVVWCFVGESFKSLLLRADTGERGRREVERSSAERALALDDRNFAVALESLQSVRLREGSRFRRTALTVTWRDDDSSTSVELYGTRSSDSQVDVVEALAEEPALSHVDIGVETSGRLL